jgi:hypothetical protein
MTSPMVVCRSLSLFVSQNLSMVVFREHNSGCIHDVSLVDILKLIVVDIQELIRG